MRKLSGKRLRANVVTAGVKRVEIVRTVIRMRMNRNHPEHRAVGKYALDVAPERGRHRVSEPLLQYLNGRKTDRRCARFLNEAVTEKEKLSRSIVRLSLQRYVGELHKDMVVNKHLGNYGNIGISGNPSNAGNPGNRGAANYGYPDVFDRLLD